MTRSATRYGLGALAVACVLGPAERTGADVVSANYVDDTLFNYEVRHMPDLDQRRDTLRGNGACYCVPTSAMNMAMYVANHGFPGVAPGVGYWQGQPLYGAATVSIFLLGELMGTADGVPPPPPPDTPCGTGGGAGNAGFTEWMEPYPAFIVNDHLTDGDFSPTFLSVSKSLIGGNLGTVGRGRYFPDEEEASWSTTTSVFSASRYHWMP